MIPTKLRRQSTQISSARWAAYAAAGAATALCHTTAEAEIHYSGRVHQSIGKTPGLNSATFPLESDITLKLTDWIGGGEGVAQIRFLGAVASGFVGDFVTYGGVYVSNLKLGALISQLRFVNWCYNDVCVGATIGFGDSSPNGKFREPGDGFIGFNFNRGAGTQYGWVRIRTTGEPLYQIIVQDYAWGDPGDSVRTGQRTDSNKPTGVPYSGSLGLLALGSVGIRAWRRKRRARKLSQT